MRTNRAMILSFTGLCVIMALWGFGQSRAPAPGLRVLATLAGSETDISNASPDIAEMTSTFDTTADGCVLVHLSFQGGGNGGFRFLLDGSLMQGHQNTQSG